MMRTKQLQQHPRNGVNCTSSSKVEVEIETPKDEVTPNVMSQTDGIDLVDSNPEISDVSAVGHGRTKEVTFDIGDSRRSSVSTGFVPDESDMESETGLEMEDMPSRIPK
jgi:hypothetical protein